MGNWLEVATNAGVLFASNTEEDDGDDGDSLKSHPWSDFILWGKCEFKPIVWIQTREDSSMISLEWFHTF